MKLKLFKNKFVRSAEEKSRLKTERTLLILSGVLLGISFPPFPFPFTILIFFALIPYFYVVEKRQTLGEKNRATYLTFFVFSVITLYWVGSWQKQADTFLMIAGGTLLFVNPLFFLIPSTLQYFVKKIFPQREVIFIFPFFWVTYEYLYMLTDLSFPWLTLGNGLAKFTAFIQIADIIGAVGLSIVIIYINIFLYKAFINYKNSRKKFAINLSTSLLIFILVLSYGLYKLSSFQITNNKIRVGLIQPNLDPWDKWNTKLDSLTNSYLSLSQKAAVNGAKLIIWPETALPVYLLDGSNGRTLDSIYSFIKRNDVYLLTGMPDFKFYFKGDKISSDAIKSKQGNYYSIYNGIILLSPDSWKIQHYGKMKLVPFGERVPFVDKFPFLGDLIKWGVGISGWNIGRDTINFELPYNIEENFSSKDSIHINGLVCYESIFPYFVDNFVKRGAEIIAIVTNDSWYGNSSGPYQHEDIAVLRAVENRRSVIRAANGGISCIIDPLGRIKEQSEMYTKTFLVGDVPLEFGETFFTKHSLIIPIISSVVSLWVFGFFILKKLKDKLKL
ncbi:MAG: apolipoprotein N-acyltransferase [Bacteroidetes bacterium]|nr:apolipoprotein N-acyltransferase [Bacteroidota bacterium]